MFMMTNVFKKEAYSKNNGIRMLADASGLRSLSYAIKSLVKNKKSVTYLAYEVRICGLI